MILDATAAPADISYPNDLGILNQARVQIEKILDSLYKTCQTKGVKKPRTYKKKARKNYLCISQKASSDSKRKTGSNRSTITIHKKKLVSHRKAN